MTADNRYSRSLSATMLRSALGRLPRARPSLAPADHIGRAADRRREIAMEPDEPALKRAARPGWDVALEWSVDVRTVINEEPAISPAHSWARRSSTDRATSARRSRCGSHTSRRIIVRAHAAERSLGRPRRVPPRRNRAKPQNACDPHLATAAKCGSCGGAGPMPRAALTPRSIRRRSRSYAR